MAGIADDCRYLQFDRLLAAAEFEEVASFLDAHPRITLRAYGGYDGSITNLDFLVHFPTLKRFRVDALYNHLTDIAGLRYLPSDLEEFGFGETRRRFSLDLLRSFPSLKKLWLEGQTKSIEAISDLRGLIDLSLRSITLPDLQVLTPLRELRLLDLKLGGTRDLSLLPEVGKLEYIELWMVRGLCDVSALGATTTLRYLFLQSLKNVTTLPSLAACDQLAGLGLESMKGITDLAPLATAPNLQQLVLRDMSHLTPSDLQPLVGCPSLREATILIGKSKDRAVHERIDLPPVTTSNGGWRHSVAQAHL